MSKIESNVLEQVVKCLDPYKGEFLIKVETLYEGLNSFCAKIKNERIVYLNDFYRLLGLETIEAGDLAYFDSKLIKEYYPIRLFWHIKDDLVIHVELEYIYLKRIFVE